ncbi:outer membrane lipoprotein carrier protein LolA [Desulfurobacterium sp.]|uniref:LolA family protein n=1 Tax=Desulfurobacterium sp. TaxID=2004706 RepID=UPI00261BCCA0|nr:outer membrane lipoprotein carrier protein LolA [Desulfurobacterium sp.]
MKALSLALITLLFVTPSWGNEPCKVITNLFKGTNTAYILFSQKTSLPIAGNNVTLYKGEIFYKRPLQFMWHYTWGSKMKIISDGKSIETCFDDGSCQIYSLSETTDLFPLLLLAESPEIFLDKYRVVKTQKSKNSEICELEAKDKNLFFKKLIFFFKKEKLKSFKTIQRDGTEETFIIKEIKLNVPINKNIFKLKE